ncbi:hypothetical protein O181_018710 [Austropuccinia psidii MF-1]|uniref:Chromo domain-containing protein n=1 Tax=Austropuccinia psidii MF-1 TaxID=1389203 RepID=A0A9Q3CAC3_9BASI|nr:hypothetical protein [Austropuccinia psidii MF-1]
MQKVSRLEDPPRNLQKRGWDPLKSCRILAVIHITSSFLNNGTEEQEEWEVAQVLESNLKRFKLWYLVDLKAFSEDPERATWEPASNLTNSPDHFKDLHTLYPDKPGPNTSEFDFMVLGGEYKL